MEPTNSSAARPLDPFQPLNTTPTKVYQQNSSHLHHHKTSLAPSSNELPLCILLHLRKASPDIRPIKPLLFAHAVVAILERLYSSVVELEMLVRSGKQLLARPLDVVAQRPQAVGVGQRAHWLSLTFDQAQHACCDARHGAEHGDGQVVVAFGGAEDDEGGGDCELEDHCMTPGSLASAGHIRARGTFGREKRGFRKRENALQE